MPHNQPNSSPLAADQKPSLSDSFGVGRSVLTEATRQADIIHTSLAGMTAIVLVLLAAVALPVFGYPPVNHLWALMIMAFAALGGIGVLYYMNYKVHQHVSQQARLTEVLVNSLGQGFLSFDRNGICAPVYSQACLELLETSPAGHHIQDVLRIPETQRADFSEWMDVLYMPNHALGFDDVIKFMPQFFPHSQGRRISLMYRPITAKDGSLTQIVVIATDQTEEYAAQQHARKQQDFVEMICRVFKERNQFQATLTHLKEFLEAADQPNIRREEAAPLLRSLHTLKAAVKHFNLVDLGAIIHKLEVDLRAGDHASDDQFRRELGLGRQQIAEALANVKTEVRDVIGTDSEWRGNMHEVEESAVYEFAREMQERKADPELVRRFLNTIVAVPLNDCFRAFERELRDLAEIMGKQVKPIRFTGTNPRVLTRSIQNFLFSLTHICRNIIDHGIEPPITRMARGKDPAGQVSIHSEIATDSRGEWLHLVIGDDGNGIDPSRIRAKLADEDPQGPWRNEDDQAIIQRIFGFGFSTREDVTEISGQGVGMEAVEQEVKLLGGTIKVQSEHYKGVRFDIKIPYTLSFEEPGSHQSPALAAKTGSNQPLSH